ncbi:synapsin ATP binding domain containing protein, partial [Entamoeba invadens IP1]
MMYFSNINDITNTHEDAPITFPCVVKVSCTNAGFGKSLIKSASELDDLISILSLGNDYYTIEPYLDVDYEVRIQRIGKYTRTFKRQSTTSWKNNWGQLKYEDTPLKSEYVHWCDECQKVFDIELFAVDVLVLKDGREVVIETNNTANGLMWEHEEEDRTKIKEVVLEKMNQVFH